jgi:hypothetical protein
MECDAVCVYNYISLEPAGSSKRPTSEICVSAVLFQLTVGIRKLPRKVLTFVLSFVKIIQLAQKLKLSLTMRAHLSQNLLRFFSKRELA